MRLAETLRLSDGTELLFSDIECPYCLAPLSVDPSDDLEGCPGLLEGDTEAECPVCEREFTLVYDYIPSFAAMRIQEGEGDGENR